MKQDQQPKPTNYEEALEVLGKYRARKIANNTYLEVFDPMYRETDGGIGIRLHSTYIILFYASGTTELNTGGYHTQTTLDRMNRYLPFGCHLYVLDGEWVYMPSDGIDVKFYEHMTIDSLSGKVLRPFHLSENDKRK